jgi:hypothetical protein
LICRVKTAAAFLLPLVRKKTAEERERSFWGFAELTAETMEPIVFVCLSGQYPLLARAVPP